MDSEYKKALARLNTEQKKAVIQIDGPLLVIAGPGTGKTQLLSMRVANILKTTDTNAANILCLTFTNKAAVNMKDRIMELAGPTGAKVSVRTFHSFAGEIMNAYPDHFWNAAPLSVAPSSVQLDIIESIVASLPLENPLALKFAGQYTLLADIQQSINLAKDAGLTPDKLRAIINANLAYINQIEKRLLKILDIRLSLKVLPLLEDKMSKLPAQPIDKLIRPLVSLSTVLSESLGTAIAQDLEVGKCTETGKWKRRWVQIEAGEKGMFAERRRNEWWLKLADVYESYRTAMHERGFYDYADMLVETIVQMEQNPDILADLQERFTYVMIDEFQDTNPAQLRLAHLVADHAEAAGRPNLMAVGDDDQSIFKFNGAELNNMLDFRRSYPGCQTIVLTDSYRSSQSVLNTARAIIEQADDRLVKLEPSLSKNLISRAVTKKGEIRATAYASRELQLSRVARDIKTRYATGESIAVLARGHDSLIRITGLLEQLDVPVRYEQQANILDHELVKQTGLTAELLVAIRQGDKQKTDGLIHHIVRSTMWGIQAKDLWHLALKAKSNWLDAMLASSVPALRNMAEWLVWLSHESSSQPLAVTIEQILGLRQSGDFTSPIRDYYRSRSHQKTNDYLHGLSAIQLLRSLVHEFAREKETTLEDLARFIEINRTNGQVVADESPFITGREAVQLLTVHKAKGLEFDNVYIIDAIEDNWHPRSSGRKPPSNLPLRPAQDDFNDYARLMYVAVTRAKSSVLISGYYQDHAGKDVAISSIVQAAMPLDRVQERDNNKLIEVLEENLHWPALSGGKEKEMLKARLETYSLSVTHLLNFLDLTRGGPQYFKERNLLRLPELKTVNLAFGTAVHAALQQGQILANKGRFSLPSVKKAFADAFAREQQTRGDIERFGVKGEQTLERLFKEFKYSLPKGSLPEQQVAGVKLNQAVIGGKLDRVDQEGGLLRIVDYKTGGTITDFNSRDKNQALRIYKHRTQLIFYALLAREHPVWSKHSKIECQMVYLEADQPSELVRSYCPTPEEIARIRLLVEAVWRSVTRLELPDTSKYTADIEGILAFEQDLIDGK